MPNRIIKESICTSDSIDALSLEAERLFYRLIVNCDDYGTFDARTAIIKSKCFPLRAHEITDGDLYGWLSELVSEGMVFFYENNGKKYMKMTSWESHQQVRAKRSKHPLPTDENSKKIDLASNGYQMISNVPVIQSNPNPIRIQSESESESNPIGNSTCVGEEVSEKPNVYGERFAKFWEAYPRKQAKGNAEKVFKRLKVSAALLDKMLDAIAWQKTTDEWKKDNGQFIPHPASWLNSARWEDEKSNYTTAESKYKFVN